MPLLHTLHPIDRPAEPPHEESSGIGTFTFTEDEGHPILAVELTRDHGTITWYRNKSGKYVLLEHKEWT